MKLRPKLLLTAVFLALAVACGTASPTPAVGPQSSAEIEKAAVELFDDWIEATAKHDAVAVYSLLSRGITEICTVEEFEEFFVISENALTYPDMAVKDVFVAGGNSEEAIMTMELLGEPRSGDQGLRDKFVADRSYRIVREGGRWRMVFEIFAIPGGCPFIGTFSRATPLPTDSSTPSP